MTVFLEIFVFFPLQDKEKSGEYHGHHFRYADGPPDAVQTKEQRQNQYRGDLTDQGSYKGDHRGDQAVIQRCEHGTAKKI